MGYIYNEIALDSVAMLINIFSRFNNTSNHTSGWTKNHRYYFGTDYYDLLL